MLVHVDERAGIIRAEIQKTAVGEHDAPGIAAPVIAAIDRLGDDLRALVLDMQRVRILNSAGLGMCIDLRNRAEAHQATAILFGINDDLKHLLELVKIRGLFKIADDERALKRLT